MKEIIFATGNSGKIATLKSYFIAGDWTPYAGQIKGSATVISCNAPLAQQLCGKKVGDTVMVGRNAASVDVIE